MMKKIIGLIICILLITTSGFSVVGINDKEDRSYKENVLSFLNNPKPDNKIDEWPMFHHDPIHTGNSTSPAPDTNDILWSTSIGDWGYASPVVADGYVYACGQDIHGGFLNCYNAYTGEQKWSTYINDEFWTMTIIDNRIYILGDYYYLYCIDAETGVTQWTYSMYGESCPAVVNNKIYIGNYGGGVYCLNATTASVIWTFDITTDYQICSPAVANGKVYIGSGPYNQPGILYCLDADTGLEIWNYPIPGSNLCSSPTVYNDKVYIADSQLHCFNATTGGQEWAISNIITDSSPAIAYENIYIPCSAGMYAFNATTGDQVWHYDIGETWSSPAIADGKVYFVSRSHHEFLCLNAFNGEEIWNYSSISQFTYSSPAIAYGNVYLTNYDSGTLLVFGTPNEPPNTPIEPDGPHEGRTNTEYTFNTYSTDPEEDDIYYLFNWGDGTDSDWIGPYASGEEVSASHMWTEIGEYDITVKAHDRRRESNWSEPLIINITTLPPDAPSINGPTSGKQGTKYKFTFNSEDPEGQEVYYYIKWGDGCEEEWNGPHPSGEDFVIAHSFPGKKTFTIEAKAKDTYGAESNWSQFEINIPRTRASSSLWYEWFFERFPNAFPILRHILGL